MNTEAPTSGTARAYRCCCPSCAGAGTHRPSRPRPPTDGRGRGAQLHDQVKIHRGPRGNRRVPVLPREGPAVAGSSGVALRGALNPGGASAAGHDEREVVVLLVGAEGADLLHERRDEGLGRAVAVPAEGVDETLLAELLAGVVEGLRDPVGVEGEEVVGLETALPHRALPLPEEPQDGRGRLQPFQGPVTTQEERAKVAAVHVAEPAGGVVVVGKEE